MYVLSNKNGPVVCFTQKADAEKWASRFDMQLHEVIDGDNKEPGKLKTGYVNMLDPGKKPTYHQDIITFTIRDSIQFPDPNGVVEGDVFYKSNLENMYFAIPDDKDPNDLVLDFWKKLHKRNLDLKRQAVSGNEQAKFKIVSIKDERDISPESPTTTSNEESNSLPTPKIEATIGSTAQSGLQGGDPRLKLPITESSNNPTG